jgi:hypothetical protein
MGVRCFPKCRAGLNYCLVVGPLFNLESTPTPHPRAVSYTNSISSHFHKSSFLPPWGPPPIQLPHTPSNNRLKKIGWYFHFECLLHQSDTWHLTHEVSPLMPKLCCMSNVSLLLMNATSAASFVLA